MRADWILKIWTKEDRSMKKFYLFFGASDARNLFVLTTLVCLLFAACAKNEVAQEDSIANAAQAGAAETQDDPAGDDQGNSNQGDPADPESPSQHGSDYISPDQFNLIPVSFNACADEDNASQGPAQAGAFTTKALFSMEDAASREELLDEDAEGAESAFGVKTTLSTDNKISWVQGDELKVYYYNGEENYTTATIKHDGATSTFDALINPADKYYYAFYPNNDAEHCPVTTSVTYEGDATYEYGAMTITIPSTQNGAFENCHLAVGKATAEDKQFTFSNVGSYMKLKVANTTATALTIQATNTSDKIVGTFTVPFAEDGLGIDEENIEVTSGSSSVTVDLPTPREPNMVVYVALLPGVDFTDGFRIRYEYGDSKVHPGFAYVKRNNGARTNRQVDRKKILNFATASVPTLDDRIREKYFVKEGDGSYDDVDVTGAGSSWDKPLSAAGLTDLLSQPVDGSYNQIDDDDYDRAWMLDGATIHVAEGEYELGYTAGKDALKMEYTYYDRQVKVNFLGAYPASSCTGTNLPVRDTTHATILKPTAGNGIFVLGNQTDVSFDGFTFQDVDVDLSQSALHVAAGATGDATVNVTHCVFKDNQNTVNYTGAACTFNKSTVLVEHCLFTGNIARNAAGLNVNSTSAVVTVRNCLFDDNSTYNTSGAMQTEDGELTVEYCTFNNNQVAETDTTYVGFGGAFHANGTNSATSVTTFNHCKFTNNGSKLGGALSLQTATVTCNDCVFSGNLAWKNKGQTATKKGLTEKNAGGVALLDAAGSKLTFNNCTLTGNSAPYACAGAIAVTATNAELTLNAGTTVSGNYSWLNGGAIYCQGKMTVSGTSSTPVTFTHNYTTATSQGSGNGGAMHLDSSSQSTLEYAAFSGNVAGGGAESLFSNGGGIYLFAPASFSAEHCTFTGHLARNGGGFCAFATSGSHSYTLTDCQFTANYLDNTNAYFSGSGATIGSCNFHGGAACVQGVGVTFVRCVFTDNKAYNGAGALHINDSNSSVTCTDCSFTQNQVSGATGDAGAVFVEYGNFTASGTTFTENVATLSGGGIFFNPAIDVTLTNCGFDGNSAGTQGDAIAMNGAALTLTGNSQDNNYIKNHTATHAIHAPNVTAFSFDHFNFKDNTSDRNGSLLNLDNTLNRTFTISDSNLEGNSAPNGGVIYADLKQVTDITAGKGDCTIESTTIKNNTATDADSKGGAIYWNCASWKDDMGSPCLRIGENSTLQGNRAGDAGSAVYLNVGRVCAGDCTVSGNTFLNLTKDSDSYGGTFFVNSKYSKLDIENCIITGNNATGKGGVVNCNGGRVFMTGCTCNNNTARSRGGALFQTGEGFLLARECSFYGNYVASGWGDFMHVNNTNCHSMFLNCTIYDGGTSRKYTTLNGSPNLLMVNCTVIGNNSNPVIRVENGKSGLLLNNIIINEGTGYAVLNNAGGYNWSAKGDYNILGTYSNNEQEIDNFPGTNDQTGKTISNMGSSWHWDDDNNGYFIWDGTVGGTRVSGWPLIDNSGRTDAISTGLDSGFNFNFGTEASPITDGKDFSVYYQNLGNWLLTDWGQYEYYFDQRGEGVADRRLVNTPGAYVEVLVAPNVGGGGSYSDSDINTNEHEY